jgi:hypothetical protein
MAFILRGVLLRGSEWIVLSNKFVNNELIARVSAFNSSSTHWTLGYMYHSILEDIANCFVNSDVQWHIAYFTHNTMAVQISLTILVILAPVFCGPYKRRRHFVDRSCLNAMRNSQLCTFREGCCTVGIFVFETLLQQHCTPHVWMICISVAAI